MNRHLVAMLTNFVFKSSSSARLHWRNPEWNLFCLPLKRIVVLCCLIFYVFIEKVQIGVRFKFYLLQILFQLKQTQIVSVKMLY